MITVREFNKTDKEPIFDMIKEINEFDGNFEGFTVLRNITDFEGFLSELEIWKNQDNLNPKYSSQTVFGLFNDEKLIGSFTLRHTLIGDLFNHGGNIGYLIRPSERNKGYGKILLKLALEEVKKFGLEKVLVTCRTDNIPSSKVIEANGGVYINNYYDKTFKRYWIEI